MAVERAGASYSELLASLAEEEAVVPAIVVVELLAQDSVRAPGARGALVPLASGPTSTATAGRTWRC